MSSTVKREPMEECIVVEDSRCFSLRRGPGVGDGNILGICMYQEIEERRFLGWFQSWVGDVQDHTPRESCEDMLRRH
jgi:hypothetical protein